MKLTSMIKKVVFVVLSAGILNSSFGMDGKSSVSGNQNGLLIPEQDTNSKMFALLNKLQENNLMALTSHNEQKKEKKEIDSLKSENAFLRGSLKILLSGGLIVSLSVFLILRDYNQTRFLVS